MSRDHTDPAQTALALDPPDGPGPAPPPTRPARIPADGPSDETIRRLFAVSMNRCAFPGCSRRIIDPATRAIQAAACHIHAGDEGGPRYDANQSRDERHGFDNLVLLCADHHRFIDAREALSHFTPAALAQMKATHEREARKQAVLRLRLSDEQLAVLQGMPPQVGAAGQEFRHALSRSAETGPQAKVAVVGTTRLPAILLAQGDDSGAGIDFRGRPVDSDDIARGLRIGSMFLANSVAFPNSLLDVTGGGWTYIAVATPAQLRVPLALVVDFGDVEPWTLLRFTVRVSAPSGAVAHQSLLDLEVPDTPDLVKRVPLAQFVEFVPHEHGAWTITVSSSTHLLGTHRFECRQAG